MVVFAPEPLQEAELNRHPDLLEIHPFALDDAGAAQGVGVFALPGASRRADGAAGDHGAEGKLGAGRGRAGGAHADRVYDADEQIESLLVGEGRAHDCTGWRHPGFHLDDDARCVDVSRLAPGLPEKQVRQVTLAGRQGLEYFFGIHLAHPMRSASQDLALRLQGFKYIRRRFSGVPGDQALGDLFAIGPACYLESDIRVALEAEVKLNALVMRRRRLSGEEAAVNAKAGSGRNFVVAAVLEFGKGSS